MPFMINIYLLPDFYRMCQTLIRQESEVFRSLSRGRFPFYDQ